jgi:hypothetical protein
MLCAGRQAGQQRLVHEFRGRQGARHHVHVDRGAGEGWGGGVGGGLW